MQASSTSNLLCALNPSGHCLAVSSADSRIRILDTGTGQPRLNFDGGRACAPGTSAGAQVPADVRERVSCLCWGDAAQPDLLGSTPPVILGTAEGSICTVDTVTGDVLWRAPDCHEGAVTAVASTSAPEAAVVSVGRDGQVVQLNALTGARIAAWKAGKGQLTSVTVSADGRLLLVGGLTLVLWDATTRDQLRKFAGHAAPVHAMAFSPNGAFAVSCAESERHIVAWSTRSREDSSNKRSKAAGLISLPDAVTSVCTSAPAGLSGSAGNDFQVAGLTRDGDARVWSVAAGKKKCAAVLTAHIRATPSPAATSSGVFALQFTSSHSLLAVHGSAVHPSFERVNLPEASTSGAAVEVTLQPSQDGVLLPTSALGKAKAARQNHSAAAAVVAPHATGDLGLTAAAAAARGSKRRRLDNDSSAVEGHTLMNGSAPALANGVLGDSHSSEEDGSDVGGDLDDGQTLGERLQRMDRAPAQVQQLQQEVETEGGELLPEGPMAIQADSLVTLLTQALHSSDNQLLERCLGVQSASIVSNTVRGLGPQDASLLLRTAVDRLQSRPARGRQLSTWPWHLLLHHAGYLMAGPGAQTSLASLYQIIESRLALQRPLASLAGRLDLLCAQIPSIAENAQRNARALPFGGPQVVLQDDVEAEDALAPGDLAGSDSELGDFSGDELPSDSDLSD